MCKDKKFFCMLNLFIISDLYNGFSLVFLDLLSFICILSGISIIITKNPIISVLFLILLFSTVACYLILLGIVFIGISYLLVYVGAVSILFLFILMLINIRVSELTSETYNNKPLATIISFIFVILFSLVLPNNENTLKQEIYIFLQDIFSINNIHYVSSKSWDNNLVDITDIASIGNIIYTTYSIWLLITSIILLLAMVGAIIITIKQKN